MGSKSVDIKQYTSRLVVAEWVLFALCSGLAVVGAFDLWIVFVTGGAAVVSLMIYRNGSDRQ